MKCYTLIIILTVAVEVECTLQANYLKPYIYFYIPIMLWKLRLWNFTLTNVIKHGIKGFDRDHKFALTKIWDKC